MTSKRNKTNAYATASSRTEKEYTEALEYYEDIVTWYCERNDQLTLDEYLKPYHIANTAFYLRMGKSNYMYHQYHVSLTEKGCAESINYFIDEIRYCTVPHAIKPSVVYVIRDLLLAQLQKAVNVQSANP